MFIQQNRPLNPEQAADRTVVLTIYFLYTAVCITGILGPLIGLIIALFNKRKISSDMGKSHIENQIRIFTKSAIGFAVGVVLLAVTFFSVMRLKTRSYDYLFIPGLVVAVAAILWFFAKSLQGFARALSGRVN